MAQNTENPGGGETRRADPNAAEQDPKNVAQQQQIAADHDALQEQKRRTEATTPPDIRARSQDS